MKTITMLFCLLLLMGGSVYADHPDQGGTEGPQVQQGEHDMRPPNPPSWDSDGQKRGEMNDTRQGPGQDQGRPDRDHEAYRNDRPDHRDPHRDHHAYRNDPSHHRDHGQKHPEPKHDRWEHPRGGDHNSGVDKSVPVRKGEQYGNLNHKWEH